MWYVWGILAKHAGRAYIAGPELDDALTTCRRLGGLGFSSTICFWNTEDDPALKVEEACAAALAAISTEELDCYLSVKLPPLGLDGRRLSEVLRRAGPRQPLVHFDSLGPDEAEQTFAVIAKSAQSYPRLGCTLPGRWLRSCEDADRAIDLGLHVRVVKGQWPDPEHPDIDLREGYLNVIGRLAGRAREVAVATHDGWLGRTAIERLQSAGTPCTLELLYGLPARESLKIARAAHVPVRVYVPFGHGWLPYTLSHARQNPRVVWWVLRDVLAGGSPFGRSKAAITPASTRAET